MPWSRTHCFVTAVVFAAAAIANNNLQDLKTGHLVDATPWKQQVALVIGVIAGSAIIPPILDLLNPRLWLRRSPRPAPRGIRCPPPGGADMGPGSGGHPEQRGLEPDPDRWA